MDIKVTITTDTTDTPDISDGYATYTAKIEMDIDGKETSDSIECWCLCGWLKPGAHRNLDGSGLDLWGDSQPGGWECLPNDGQSYGTPSVSAVDDYSAIRLETSTAGALLAPVGVWKEALEAFRRTNSDDDLEKLEDIYDRVCAAIDNAIESYDWEIVDAPDAEDVFSGLDHSEVSAGDIEIRVGDWCGCGMVVAWRDADGDYDYDYWPTEEDIQRILHESGYADAAIADAADYLIGHLEVDNT